MTVTHRKNAGIRHHCDACMKDVSDIPYIRCAVCSDALDLCVECFAAGAEVASHRRDHEYRVMDSLRFPVFDAAWGAEEELMLIEAIEKCGMGNWAEITDYMGAGRSKEEVEIHYYAVYVQSEMWPVPDVSVSVDTLLEPPTKRQRLGDADVTDIRKHSKPFTSMPCNHEVTGFMPGRGEFETDYGGEIEEMCVKELAFDDNDSLEDEKFKLLIMDIYNAKLERKLDRKRLILDNKLYDYKKIVAAEKKRSREERDLINRSKIFARMQTADDFEVFVNGLLYEMQLREQIAALQNYRRQGITTLAAAQQFEIERARRAGLKPQLLSIPIPPPIMASELLELPQSLIKFDPEMNVSADIKMENESPTIRKHATPLDLSLEDGVHLLTHEEQQLCSQLRLVPKSYLVIKDTVIKEYTQLGYMRRRQCRALIKIDVNKTSRLYDFFLEMGWVRPPQRKQQLQLQLEEQEQTELTTTTSLDSTNPVVNEHVNTSKG